MKSKVCKVILMFVLVIGFGLCLLYGEDHYWKFNETSGNIAYDSLGNVNGTLMGCAAFLPAGEGVHLNGSNDSYVSFGTSVGQFGMSNFTVYLEFKTSDKSEYYDIVGNRTTDNHGNFFDIYMTGEGRVYAEVDEDANAKNHILVKSNKAGLNDGNWHFLMAVRESNTLTIYIDGNLDSSNSNTTGKANINNGKEFKLGRSLEYSSEKRFAPNAVYRNLLVFLSSNAEEAVVFDTTKLKEGVIDTGAGGMNLSWCIDSDKERPRKNSNSTMLKEMKCGSLRFPCGHGADNYLWDTPPYGGTLTPKV